MISAHENAETIVAAHIKASPIAGWLGFSTHAGEKGHVYTLAFNEAHIGNPTIRALHGGVVAAFLEFSAQCELTAMLDATKRVRAINIDVDYLSSARAKDMAARVTILRTGRRIAFVEATCWQQSEERPVARGHFRMRIEGAVSA